MQSNNLAQSFFYVRIYFHPSQQWHTDIDSFLYFNLFTYNNSKIILISFDLASIPSV